MVEHTSHANTPDFARREYGLPELLDGECSYGEWKAASLSLARLNQITGAYKPVLAFLERAVERNKGRRSPLYVLDVGCGHGDTLRAVHEWARKRGVSLRLTGIDATPYAARLAQERDREAGLSADAISWVIGDIFTWTPQPQPDLILSSLFAHHLSDLDLLRFLQWCEGTAVLGWLTVDLTRSARAVTMARWLTTLLGMHRFIQHDAPVSFRRAFSQEEWQALLRGTGLARAQLLNAGRGRIAVESFR